MLKTKLTQNTNNKPINLALYSHTVATPKVFQVDNTNDSQPDQRTMSLKNTNTSQESTSPDQNVTAASSENQHVNSLSLDVQFSTIIYDSQSDTPL